MSGGGANAGAGGPMTERMQALLARAAEEQLHEQRQVSAVLAELRDLLVDLGQQVGEGLGQLETRLDELDRRVETMAERAVPPPPPPPPSPTPPPTAGAVAAALAERLGDGLVALVQQEVLPAVAGSERRLAAHVDEAVLALAGVLLRRGRPGRADAAATPDFAAPGEAAAAGAAEDTRDP